MDSLSNAFKSPKGIAIAVGVGVLVLGVIALIIAGKRRQISASFKERNIWSNVFPSSSSNSKVGAVYASSSAVNNPPFKAFDGKDDTYWRTKNGHDKYDATTGEYVEGSAQQDERISKKGAGLRFHSNIKSFLTDGYEIQSQNALSWSVLIGGKVVDTQTVSEPPAKKPKNVLLDKQYESNDYRLVIHKIVPGTGSPRVTHFNLYNLV